MKPWALWLIKHRMSWLLKVIVVLSYPLILLGYYEEAVDDVRYTFGAIDYEELKHD